MYSDKKNILQLVALLEAHGITKVVLCPGSRNAPIVHTLSTHPGFTCYAMTDERSAVNGTAHQCLRFYQERSYAFYG